MTGGPLTGVRVLELAGIGPGPFAAMVLSDLGADVVRVDRRGGPPLLEGDDPRRDPLRRGRRSIAVDLKHPDGLATVLALAERADVLVDPFRPGVLERLGLGPDVLEARAPRLVVARMTGWGQDGPLARAPGHDIDYVAIAGPLAAIGPADRPPPPPLNLVGDFGGGGMLCVIGVLAALLERGISGRGQVVDAAMVDGAALQLTGIAGWMAQGLWDQDARAANLLDGGAPFYATYACKGGGYVAVGALEPQFYAALLAGVGLEPGDWPQSDRGRWPALAQELTERFATRTRDEWCAALEGGDACLSPVLTARESAAHPHNAARGLWTEAFEVAQPSPAPRFARTPAAIAGPPPGPGEHTEAVLAELGRSPREIESLLASGAVATAPGQS